MYEDYPPFHFSLEGTINHVGLLEIPFRFSIVSEGKFFNGNYLFFYGIIIFKGKLSHLSGKNTKNKSGNIPSRQWSIFNGSLRNYIQVLRRCTNGTWIATGIIIWHGVLNQSQGRSLQSFSFSPSFTLSYFVGKGIYWHWFATMVSMNKSSV